MRYVRIAQITLALSTAALLGACSTVRSTGSAVGDAASDTGRAIGDTVVGSGQFVVSTGAAIGTEMADQFHSPTLPPNDPLRFDGSYKGVARLVQGGPGCPASRRGVVMVGDNTLTYAYTPNQVFRVPVGADGSLHGVAGSTTLDGQIVNDRLTMTIKGPDCATDYVASFTLNHS